MAKIEYRELCPIEQRRAAEQESMCSPSERVAFLLLPEIMRVQVERHPPIAFKDSWIAYYPDFLFRDARICIEIDGGYHENRKELDLKRDNTFEKHGFTVIRILNRDTNVSTAFWQRLIEGLEKAIGKNPEIASFIKALQKMFDDATGSWTKLNTNQYSDDSFYKHMEQLMHLKKKCRVKRKREKKTYPFYFY